MTAAAPQDSAPHLPVLLDAVIHAPHPYRRWVTTVATAAMGAGTSLLAGGGWVVVLTSIISAAVISRVLTTIGRRGVPGFFAQAIGAAVPTVFAIGLAVVQESGAWLDGLGYGLLAEEWRG